MALIIFLVFFAKSYRKSFENLSSVRNYDTLFEELEKKDTELFSFCGYSWKLTFFLIVEFSNLLFKELFKVPL